MALPKDLRKLLLCPGLDLARQVAWERLKAANVTLDESLGLDLTPPKKVVSTKLAKRLAGLL